MKVILPVLNINLKAGLNRLGYAESRDPNVRELAFVRRLGRLFYPRFHLYVNQGASGLVLNLHLDQKKPSYQGVHAHSAEYEGEIVSREADRLLAFFKVSSR